MGFIIYIIYYKYISRHVWLQQHLNNEFAALCCVSVSIVKGENVGCNPKCAVQIMFIISGFYSVSGSMISIENNSPLLTGGWQVFAS